MAPELLSGSLPRPTSDLYAFGMTLYELYMDEIPMSPFLMAILSNSYSSLECGLIARMRTSAPGCMDIWTLAERCWSKDPKARPTARQIHDTLNILMRGYVREPPVDDAWAPAENPSPGALPSTDTKIVQPEAKKSEPEYEDNFSSSEAKPASEKKKKASKDDKIDESVISRPTIDLFKDFVPQYPQQAAVQESKKPSFISTWIRAKGNAKGKERTSEMLESITLLSELRH
ncbi:hypothetical protein B0H11DRAFT_2248024 [Mycena galericulata]|nr:hypothetical protein B0H11DRAFT_2259591 [Mycena galericulata]KAJ7446665.1 hypothetical protein B0H11DRAFT_2248824 [Mycena galericulata]KAJ7448083.1 hypothetical protein B0H11DRAFT_2248024 [Mycena galericulata]